MLKPLFALFVALGVGLSSTGELPSGAAFTDSAALAGAASGGTARAGARVVEVVYTVRVINLDTQRSARDVKVQVPPGVLWQTDRQTVLSVRFDPEPASQVRTAGGLQTEYLIPEVEPGQELALRQVFRVELHPPRAAGHQSADPVYLAAAPGIEVQDPQIQATARAVADGKTTAAEKAAAIMDYVTSHLTYHADSPYRSQGALAALQSGEGVCTEFAYLYAALARAAGLPARVVYGWARDTMLSRGLAGPLTSENRHAWVEYWDPGQGWVSVDPTFASTRPPQARMEFDAVNHLAQDYAEVALKGQFKGGRLALGIGAELVEVAAGA